MFLRAEKAPELMERRAWVFHARVPSLTHAKSSREGDSADIVSNGEHETSQGDDALEELLSRSGLCRIGARRTYLLLRLGVVVHDDHFK
jgi:hypothetical protein